MPSTPRIESGTKIYHVMARGVGRGIIYEDDEDRSKFVSLLGESHRLFSVALHAWCLMDNHYHLLVQGELPAIAKMMRRLNSKYAQFFNEKHGRSGHLFQGRYRSEPVETDEYFLTVLRYIHQNPVRAGIARTCNYPWSSYRDYVDNPWLVDNAFTMSLLKDSESFQSLHDEVDLSAACIDLDRRLGSLATTEMIDAARAALEGVRLEEVSGLERKRRDESLRNLKAAHLSVRQIERLTGVSKSIVARA